MLAYLFALAQVQWSESAFSPYGVSADGLLINLDCMI